MTSLRIFQTQTFLHLIDYKKKQITLEKVAKKAKKYAAAVGEEEKDDEVEQREKSRASEREIISTPLHKNHPHEHFSPLQHLSPVQEAGLDEIHMSKIATGRISRLSIANMSGSGRRQLVMVNLKYAKICAACVPKAVHF